MTRPRFISRRAAARLRLALRRFPAVLLLGPRQCGKTTLARRLLPDWRYLDFERPSDYDLAAADLEGFLRDHSSRLIIDEAQTLPDLFPALRHEIDRRRSNGRFLLLGSASPALIRSTSESLAGRVGLVELTPFLDAELQARPQYDQWFWGGFPPLVFHRSRAARVEWLDSFIRTLVTSDLAALAPGLNPVRLRRLWTMLAHVHGGILNQNDLSRALGVSLPVEIKSGVSIGAMDLRGLKQCLADLRARRALVVTRGGERRPAGSGIELIPFSALRRAIEQHLGA